jgi:hypothetical protein
MLRSDRVAQNETINAWSGPPFSPTWKPPWCGESKASYSMAGVGVVTFQQPGSRLAHNVL